MNAPAGTFLLHIGASGTVDAANALTLQADGKFLVVGSSADALAVSPFAAARFNADGTLDSSFGVAGKLTMAVSPGASSAYAQASAVAVLANGAVVIAGSSAAVGDFAQVALVRTGSTGALDTSFDSDGRVVLKVSASTTAADQAAAVAVLANSKILVGGTFGLDLGVVRFNADGSLDTTFGSGGRVSTDLGDANDSGYAMVVLGDGRIVVAGGTVPGAPFEASANFALVRYTDDGLPDTSFSGDGQLTTDFGDADNATCLVVQPDGKLVAAGSSGDAFAVARYNTDGSLDNSFDADGLRTIAVGLHASANSLAVQADGKLILAGQTYGANGYDFALVRLNADGSLDTGFGVAGIVTTNLGSDDFANSVVVQADGKIIVAGASGADFALARYNANGSLDTRFGTADTTPLPGDGKSVDILAYSWKAHTLLSDVSVPNGAVVPVTNALGAIHLEAVTEPTLTLTASRPVPVGEATATGSAVNLQDAIAILKMIVGLDLNGAGKALSPYQSLAADFDGNGTVNLTDAIGVLKHVVGLTSPDPTWHFLNEADLSVPAKATLTPGIPAAAISASLSGTSPVHVGLVGYLSGDVDGSYGGAAGALDLDVTQPSYFTDLVGGNSLLNLSQFGVYPG